MRDVVGRLAIGVFSVAALVALASSCSQIVGFKDFALVDAGVDALESKIPDAAIDAAIDAPPPKLWIYVTDISANGGFGTPNGARVTADIKCQDMYAAKFTARSCKDIHAVIQVDDTVDSIARMAITFPIPKTAGVLRATDATPVARSWDDLINPNEALLAPVSASSSVVPFWSGRGVGLQCSNWTSMASTVSGIAGDATKVNQWMEQAGVACNNFNQRFLCVCW